MNVLAAFRIPLLSIAALGDPSIVAGDRLSVESIPGDVPDPVPDGIDESDLVSCFVVNGTGIDCPV